MKRKSLLIAALMVTAALAGCKAETPETTPATSTAASPTVSPTPSLAPVPPCADVKNATVHGVVDPYYAFGDAGAQLTDGMFQDKDGLVLAVQQACASGDLGQDIHNVTVATIMDSVTGTTGRFWNVMLCWYVKDKPKCTVHIEMNDRDPIESISISGGKMTMVFLTRPADAASAVVSIRRTAIYEAEGTLLKEKSHTDSPYTGG